MVKTGDGKEPVADKELLNIAVKQWELFRRVKEGTLNPKVVGTLLQLVIEGVFIDTHYKGEVEGTGIDGGKRFSLITVTIDPHRLSFDDMNLLSSSGVAQIHFNYVSRERTPILDPK